MRGSRRTARHGGLAAVAAVAIIIGTPAGAGAQDGGRFFLGPLEWTPTLELRDIGVDSNVFNTAGEEAEDFVLTFVPQVDASLTTGVMDVTLLATGEFLYFKKYVSERAVNRTLQSTVAFPFAAIVPAIAVDYARVRERATSELDVRAPRTDERYAASLTRPLTASTRLAVAAGFTRVAYDRGTEFRETEIATQLNRRSVNVGMQLAVDVTPLTQFLLDVTGSRDEFVLQGDRGTDNLRVTGTFQFSPDAVLDGRALFGYQKMIPFGNSPEFAFDGFVAGVDVGYVLLGRTRFAGQFSREVIYSVAEGEAYYVSRVTGLSIQHNLVGPLDLIARGNHEKLDYEPSVERGSGARLDRVTAFGGGVSVRATPSLTVGVNIESSKRQSTEGERFRFSRRRIYTTVTYEF